MMDQHQCKCQLCGCFASRPPCLRSMNAITSLRLPAHEDRTPPLRLCGRNACTEIASPFPQAGNSPSKWYTRHCPHQDPHEALPWLAFGMTRHRFPFEYALPPRVHFRLRLMLCGVLAQVHALFSSLATLCCQCCDCMQWTAKQDCQACPAFPDCQRIDASKSLLTERCLKLSAPGSSRRNLACA